MKEIKHKVLLSEDDHALEEAGYNGYIPKPVKEKPFLEAVERYLPR